MKKTALLAVTAATMLTTSIGFASPLTDYSIGKTSIDLIMRNTDAEIEGISLAKKSNLDFGITTGLGNKFAIQYNGYNAKSKDTAIFTGNASVTGKLNAELKTQEFNVLYQLDKNVSVYTGLVTIKGSGIMNVNVGGLTTTTPLSSNSKEKIQFGLVGSTKIAAKTSAYALVGVASDYTNWKIGVSQEIAPNLELNVDYRRLDAKKLVYNTSSIDTHVTVKGLGYGISYKF